MIHWYYFAPLILFLIWLGVMQWFGKLPSITTIHDLAEILNSRGGNILLLALMSMAFFWSAMRFTYWILNKIVDGKIDATSAFAMAGFTFITGSAFGGAFSSMLKTMTGESSPTGGTNGKTEITVSGTKPDTVVNASVQSPSGTPGSGQSV